MKKVKIERLANFIRRVPKNVSVKRKRKRLSFEIKSPTYQLHTLNLSDYGDDTLSFILEKEADGNLFVVAKAPKNTVRIKALWPRCLKRKWRARPMAYT